MASGDWTEAVGILSSGDLARGVTKGVAKPSGGGDFVFGVNSLTNTVGAYARYTNQAGFAPMTKGAVVMGALVRATSAGLKAFSGFLFAGLPGTNIAGTAYILGLSDGDPSHIELRKGKLSEGLPDEAPGGANKILRRSTAIVAPDEWAHLRLEVVCNDNGDVVLSVHRNDLAVHGVDSPVFETIDGMDPFIDDALQVNTGSAPLIGGRAGFGAAVADVNRRVYFDQLAVSRQT